MGVANSKAGLEEASDDPKEGSKRQRFRRRLHRHRNRCSSSNGSSSSQLKHVTADDFTGIALVQIIKAEMKFKDRWLACISLGERTFRTATSDQTDKPCWKSEKKLLLERNGPHIARLSVFETNRVSKNNLIGYCEIDLFEALSRESDSVIEVRDLLDPSSSDLVVGNISISCSVEDPVDTEKSFAMRILSVMDYDQDGQLSFSEFSDLMDAFGNEVAAKKKEELFKAADKNGDGSVSMDELANLLAIQQEKESIISSCPVCGETLGVADKLNEMIHMTLCFDEGTGNQIMTGGFLTDKQASYGWMFKLSEWAHFSSYDIGLKSGSSASNILVFDRKTKRLVEELIDRKVILSIRALYQSRVGLCVLDKGNTFVSVKNEYFASLQTFNEFFIRELKPGARPIAFKERDDIAVCAADSRVMAFKSADDSLRFWIKVISTSFTILEILRAHFLYSNWVVNFPLMVSWVKKYPPAFVHGSLVIFRLAPQDYHRFHAPTSGRIEQYVGIPGCLYTVNPIAVNSKYCNVLTENKRVIAVISTAYFGKIALVAVGATMVGSITFTKKKGDYVQKGDELGYFSFGGSTVICVFEKDAIDLDEDLLANSARSLETLVSVGMRLGVSRMKQKEIDLPKVEDCSIRE
ncbi:hypothetical protein IFM89_022347 [Coptis chinensis]|uniref:phosphatidylserine decarboxylase n=1 Tax=Coptis chinensis TaxID=261450 RepID=A0A835M4I0_9MAGN|nr:hypothetical protein IFM89_022347 [Coptis chinensis]